MQADQAAMILVQGVNEIEKAYHDHDMQEAVEGIIMAVAFVQ